MLLRLLNWLTPRLPKQVIKARDQEGPYMVRYWLLGSDKTRWAVMLHNILLPDSTECHHDHPWDFWTYVLWGGYVEEITDPGCGIVTPRLNAPGTLLHRKAEHAHRIDELPNGECWTLVLRTKRVRDWGFHTPVGWVWWERYFAMYDKAARWCDGIFTSYERHRSFGQAGRRDEPRRGDGKSTRETEPKIIARRDGEKAGGGA